MKRFVLVASLLALIVALLSGCAPAAPAAAPTTAPTAVAAATSAPVEPTKAPATSATVTYWHSMSQPETDALAQQIAKFEAANPGIKIEATRYASDNDAFKQAMLTAVAGNSFPDVARLDIAWVPQYADDGVLYQLDGNMPDFDKIKGEVFPGPLSTNFWNGHYYGLPLNTNTQVLLWNKSMFDKAGLAAPKTMAELAEVACKLSDKANEQYGYAQGGTYFWAPAPVFYAMGGKIVDDKLSTATGFINGKESAAAFTMLKDLFDKGCLSPNVMGGGLGTAPGHATGKYAMIVDGPWMVDIYKGQYPDFKIEFAPIPTGPDGKTSSVVGGEDVVIFESAKDKQAAAKWLSFLLSPEYQKAMAQVGVMPTLASLATDSSLPPYFGVFMEQLKTAQARVPHPKWQQMDDAINQAYQRILRGDQPVQASLDQAAEEINAFLK